MERLSGKYKDVYRRIESLIEREDDLVAALATIACEIHHSFEKFHWTGFYRHSEKRDCLVIGPYQGSHGCLRIPRGKGVCGAAALSRKTLVVPDFHAFPGHIACSSTTKSEIVIPLVAKDSGKLLGVLDVDSDDEDAFSDEDESGLSAICALVEGRAWKTGLMTDSNAGRQPQGRPTENPVKLAEERLAGARLEMSRAMVSLNNAKRAKLALSMKSDCKQKNL